MCRGNKACNKLVKEGAKKERDDTFDLSIPDHFNIQGAKLSAITQAIAYRGIREMNKKHERSTTQLNLEKIREDLQAATGNIETDAAIWSRIRTPPIHLKIQ